MLRMLGGIVLLIVVVGAAVFYGRERTSPEDGGLTPQQLQAYQAKAKDLNDRDDYSLVGMSTSYAEDIGTYNGRAVEFAFECWGDVCPDNGAYFIRYKDVKKENCEELGGYIVEGYSGWGRMTYGGCSPIK